jgi:Cu/Ag efflux protein CusF
MGGFRARTYTEFAGRWIMNISSALALTLILAGGAASARDFVASKAPARASESTDSRHATGLVMAVDAASGRLTVKDENGKTSRFFAKKAKVLMVEGKTISLADLSVGDHISLMYKGMSATEIIRLHKAAKR